MAHAEARFHHYVWRRYGIDIAVGVTTTQQRYQRALSLPLDAVVKGQGTMAEVIAATYAVLPPLPLR